MLHHLVRLESAILVHTDNSDQNPFDGVKPSMDFFGGAFKGTWQWWLGGAWGACIVASAFIVIFSLIHLRHINSEDNPQKKSKGRNKVIGAFVTAGALVLVPTLFAGMIFFANAGKA
ncbi:hypothetical protein [Leifsonia sp. TF02-11]|uniref:hypothetical protein n=1 Tax=Leifsonia sp. TF02-11 TaxID=2815212 RepID=UPI001AA0D4D5|nr:hypothetical protein [Leifsonia sp. TF02-11]MBO1741031.1 hypothetical protein [Leifsonia sp. TF02-11]